MYSCLRRAFFLARVQYVVIDYLATIDPHHLFCLLVDVANSINPPILKNLPKGYPGITNGRPYHVNYITEKSDRILGLKHRSREDMVRDTLTYFKEKGFAQ